MTCNSDDTAKAAGATPTARAAPATKASLTHRAADAPVAAKTYNAPNTTRTGPTTSHTPLPCNRGDTAVTD